MSGSISQTQPGTQSQHARYQCERLLQGLADVGCTVERFAHCIEDFEFSRARVGGRELISVVYANAGVFRLRHNRSLQSDAIIPRS